MSTIVEITKYGNKLLSSAATTSYSRVLAVVVYCAVITFGYYAVIKAVEVISDRQEQQDKAIELLQNNLVLLDGLVKFSGLCVKNGLTSSEQKFYCDIAIVKFNDSRVLLELGSNHKKMEEARAFSGMSAAANNAILRIGYAVKHKEKLGSFPQSWFWLVKDFSFTLFVIVLLLVGTTYIVLKVIMVNSSNKKEDALEDGAFASQGEAVEVSEPSVKHNLHECVFCTAENSKAAKAIQIVSLLAVWISIATVASIYALDAYYSMILGFALCIINQGFGKWLSGVFSSRKCSS